jgi:hypothetical protein
MRIRDMKMKKGFMKFSIVMFLTLSLVGCGFGNAFNSSRVYETEDFSVEMMTGMSKVDYEGYNYLFQNLNEETMLLVLEESFEYIGIDDSYTLEDYMGMVNLANGLADNSIVTDETTGLSYVTFESTVEGESYSYLMFATKTATSFWLFQIGCLTADYAENQATLLEWANSVEMK